MKILIEVHQGIGDVIKMIPFIKNVRRCYPNAYIAIIVLNQDRICFLQSLDVIDDFFVLNKKTMNFVDVLKLISRIRKCNFDLGFVSPMASQKKMKLFLELCSCKRVILSHGSNNDNEIVVSLSMLNDLGFKAIYENPHLPLFDCHDVESDDHRIAIFASGKNKNINTCCNNDKRKIDDTVIIAAANSLAAKGYNVILLGSDRERASVDNLLSILDCRIMNLVGKLSIMETFECMQSCHLVITAESGPAHMADAIGVETLVYQTVSDMDIVGPFSEKCHRLSAKLSCQYCLYTNAFDECVDEKCISYFTSDLLVREAEKRMLDV